MKIVYDDLFEFSEIVIRCNDTARKGKCPYCPFFDRCKIDETENRHIQCGELVTSTTRTPSQQEAIPDGKKYLTPSEVRKMTPKEVKENYDLVIQSMKYWK